MSRRYSIAQARHDLAALIHEVEEAGEAVTLTRRGHPVAMLVSLDEYRRLRGRSEGFWSSLSRFRETVDLDELKLGPDHFEGTRDHSPGRKVDLG